MVSAARRVQAGGGRLALAALLGGAVAIALAPILVRLSTVGPSATAFWRLTLALPVFFFWRRLELKNTPDSRRPEARVELGHLAAAGLFFAADLACWHWSIKFTSVANATLFANLAPVFVALGSWLFFGQPVGLGFVLGMVTALAGTTLMVGQHLTLGSQRLLGDLLGLATAVFYGGYLLAIARLRARYSTMTIMAWSGLVSSAVLLPAARLSGEQLLPAMLAGWMPLFALALISQVGGQGLIAFALAHLPASFSAVTLLVQPVMAAVFAWLFLNEALGAWQALGGALVLAGITIARQGSYTVRGTSKGA